MVLLSYLTPEQFPTKLGGKMSYGGVLPLGPVQRVQTFYVHITHPCDLLRFHARFDTDSLLFVGGAVIGYGEAGGDSPAKWIVRALKSGEQFFDVEVILK